MSTAAPRVTAAHDRLPGGWLLFAAQVGYQLRLLTRTPRTLWFAVFAPAGILALRLGRLAPQGGHQAASPQVISLVAGLAAFGILNTAYMTHAAGLVAARQDGVLRRWRLAPLPAGGYFVGRITATVLLADAGAAVVVSLGVVMAGVRVGAGTALGLLLATTVGAAAWAALGTAITAVVPTAEATFPVVGLSYLPVIFLSGTFGTVPGEPDWLATLIRWLPAQPVVDAVGQALRHTGGGLAPIPGRDLAVLSVWAAAGVLISVRFFSWMPRRPSHGRPPR